MTASVLRLLSWNLNGLDTTRLDQRTEAACIEIVLGLPVAAAMRGEVGPPMPEVLCLQEVVRRTHVTHLRNHLRAAGFVLYPESPRRDDGDYSLIAVRPPYRVVAAATVPFEYSPLGREWLEVEITDGTRSLRVLTAHMESLRSGSDPRVAQAGELEVALRRAGAPAVFLGDTNLRKAETDRLAREGFTLSDAFDVAGQPARHRDTWWPEESERGFRFDRAWLPSDSPLGVRALKTRRRPKLSDHAALELTLGV